MRRVVISLIGILVAASATAADKEAYTAVSIEWLAASAQNILRVTVLSAEPSNHRFTYQVDEVLRGQDVGNGVYQLGSNEFPPWFAVPGRPLLLFLMRFDRPGYYQFAPVDLAEKFGPPFWTNFGQPVTTAEQLLPTLRDAIAHTPPGQLRVASLRPLNETMRDVLDARRELFTIAVDHRVEPLAYELISSPKEAMEVQGMYLLSQLPSPKNVERLREYLQDPRLRIESGQSLSPWSEKTYHFRKWASKLLGVIGQPVSGIRLSEPANVYRGIGWGLLVGVVLLLLGWLAMGRFHITRPLGRRVVGMLSIMLVLLAALWIRSVWIIDDFCYADGHRLYALSISQGTVRFQVVHDFVPRMWPVHHAFSVSPQSGDGTPWHETARPANSPFATPASRQPSPIESDVRSYATRIVFFELWHIGLPLLAVVLIPLIVMLRHAAMIRARRREGLCLSCGYDLRASSDRCPECGAILQGVKEEAV